MSHNTTELYLEYLANKRKCMKAEKWYWTFEVWMKMRGYHPNKNLRPGAQ